MAKQLLLSLLLYFSFAAAKVQFSTEIQLEELMCHKNHSSKVVFIIDEQDPLLIFDDNNLKITVKLLEEFDTKATLEFTLFVKNELGEFEIFSKPVVTINYLKEAQVTIKTSVGQVCNLTISAQRTD